MKAPETEKLVGRKVNLSLLDEAGWTRDKEDSDKYGIWFKTQNSNFGGCQILMAQVSLSIEVNDSEITSYSFLVNTVDTMGQGRTFEPFMIEPADDIYAANLLKRIITD